MLDKNTESRLDALLVREGTLSELAALKQDAKDFKFRMMAREREKYKTARDKCDLLSHLSLRKLSIYIS